MQQHTIGDRIKFHRKRLGLTQEQLAQRLGVSPQAVIKWEHNQSCPDVSILPELAGLFGISVDALLGRSSEPIPEEPEQAKSNFNFQWNRAGLKDTSGVIFALYILTLGTLLLVNSIMELSVSWFTLVWTLGLVYLGILGIWRSCSLFSILVTLVGGYFLMSSYGLIRFTLAWKYVAPALILLWGLSLLFQVAVKKKPVVSTYYRSPGSDSPSQEPYVNFAGWLNCDLSFGTRRVSVVTDRLQGGQIDTSFGDFTVDFSPCESTAENCVVEIDNSFGTLTLLLPKHLAVEILETDNSCASCQVNGKPNPETRGTILLKSDNSFSNLNISYID